MQPPPPSPRPPSLSQKRLAIAMVGAWVLLISIFAAMLARPRAREQKLVEEKLTNQDASVLYPEALQQIAESETNAEGLSSDLSELLTPVLLHSFNKNLFGVAVFDSLGKFFLAEPTDLLPGDLPPADYARLLGGDPISTYIPDFAPSHYFFGYSGQQQQTLPVLMVELPLHGKDPAKTLGFVQYYILGRSPDDKDKSGLADQLAVVDAELKRETGKTLGVAAILIAVVLTAAYFLLIRAYRAIAERNLRLVRTNFELTLAAKASALGQVTSHLIHGLQGPIAGLRAVTANRREEKGPADDDWRSAADYAERLQIMIQDTVSLLGDIGAPITYELSGRELAETIQRRNTATAQERRIVLTVEGEFEARLDSHRGGLLCLIATNLAQNAFAATPPGGRVTVRLRVEDGQVILTVADEGGGIPAEAQAHLFEPGRSTRPGGTGLGLAISQLLARQLGGQLSLEATGGRGTTFRLQMPIAAAV